MFHLPLKLKVLDVQKDASGISVNATVVDASGANVEYVPLTVGPNRTPAEICAILQHHVDRMAKHLSERKMTHTMSASLSEEESSQQLENLKGLEFTGSVTT